MIIRVYAAPNHQRTPAQRFCVGLRRHGYNVKVSHLDDVKPADLAVFWGLNRSAEIRQVQEENNAPWLIMEHGYIGNRNVWTSLGYNGLNGRGEFLNKNSPPDRWNKHFNGRLKPWHKGKYVLLAGQVPGDASIRHVSFTYQGLVNKIKKHTKLPIHFRKHPHPKSMNRVVTPNGCIDSPHKTLEKALRGAHVCVTVNSNTGVEAILAGTPVINIDCGSMVWDLAQHDYKLIETPPHPEREQWAYNIAYAQWLPNEIEDGTAWDHLKTKFEK